VGEAEVCSSVRGWSWAGSALAAGGSVPLVVDHEALGNPSRLQPRDPSSSRALAAMAKLRS